MRSCQVLGSCRRCFQLLLWLCSIHVAALLLTPHHLSENVLHVLTCVGVLYSTLDEGCIVREHNACEEKSGITSTVMMTTVTTSEIVTNTREDGRSYSSARCGPHSMLSSPIRGLMPK